MKQTLLLRLISVTTALVASLVAGAGATELGIKDTQFTLNGAPTFLLGISYYGALGAPDDFVRRDLDDMQRHGFNWIRVWATWATFDHNVSAVEADGSPREPFLTKLKNLVAECDRRGLVVDVTLSRGKGEDGMPNLPTQEAHRRAVETVVTALKPYRNWYLDLGNERNVRDQRFVSFAELKQLRDDVKRLDPRRLITASQGDSDINRDDLRDYLLTVQVDFLTPHRPRHAGATAQTKKITEDYLKAANELGRVVPVHYQEPLRIGWTKWQPKAEDFVTDLSGARAGGAAGWCFHNGNQVARPDGKPRRSFDLREQRLFEQLDAEETKTLALLAKPAGVSAAPDGRQAVTPEPARGPLRVHPTNPRYFTDGSGKAIYLTGSHTWNNLVDFGTDNPPKPFDFDAYLDFLERHQHNFFRLWRWEGVAFDTRPFPQYVQPGAENIIVLHPWPRTGPGHALDGLPKFDISRFDPDYFNRLRTRVQAAGERGIYVSVMLFEGWELQHIANGWQAHPFHADNNVNDLNGDTDGDGRGIEINTLRHPAVLKFQEDYVRKVIATVGDLDNVLYEISNESGAYSIEWQYHFIRFVKDCEKSREKSHPVGMTFPYSRDPKQRGKNADLFNSPADWISPNSDAGKFNYQTNPPPALGDKVVLADTDHLGGIWGNSKWVWQSFLRGHNPIFMDPYEHRLLGKGQPNQWESVRQALGATRRMAGRIDLAQMTPVPDIASTKYCLANLGKEYLVYLPEGGEVTVDLEAVTGTVTVEWMHPLEGTFTPGEATAGEAKRQFKAPFAGDAVLYLATRKQDL